MSKTAAKYCRVMAFPTLKGVDDGRMENHVLGQQRVHAGNVFVGDKSVPCFHWTDRHSALDSM